MRAYDDSSDEEDKEDIDLEIVMGKMYEAMHVVPPQQTGYIIHPPPITLEEIQRLKDWPIRDHEHYGGGHRIFREAVPISKNENEQKECDVELISKQVGCSDKEAEEALKKANGDIVDAILNIEIK